MTTKAKTEKAPKNSVAQATAHPVKYADMKVGDLHAFTYWGTIIDKHNGQNVTVKPVDDMGIPTFGVNGLALNEKSYSADQFHEERKASKTEVAQMLIQSFNIPFTVCFEKQEGGEERVLRGRLIAPEPLLGRSQVEDLDKPANDRFRLVDHRSLKWLVVNGIKWTVGRK